MTQGATKQTGHWQPIRVTPLGSGKLALLPRPRRSQREFSLLYVGKGELILHLLRRTVSLRAGDAMLSAPGEVRHAELRAPTGWMVQFTADSLGDYGPLGVPLGHPPWLWFVRGEPDDRKVSLPGPRRPGFDWALRSLAAELHEARPAHREAAGAYLRLLILEFLRHALPSGMMAPSPLVGEVLRVVDQRYDEPISLKAVSRAVGRSPSHVTAVVRAQTGLTVLEWITERRMEEARRRLRVSDEDVSIIAERVGYGSSSHFIRQFRRSHGVAPGAWRRELHQTHDR